MYSIDRHQTIINRGLKEIEYPEQPTDLYQPIRYFLAIGGKRIRPTLTLLAAEMYDCPLERSLNIALAIEVFHNFTLLHDDIMDEAPKRRGQPSVHEQWNTNIAILSGDTMLITAYQLLAKSDPAILPSLLATFNRAAIEVCQGQQFDMQYEQQDLVTIEEYLGMVRLKTAVLLGAALRMGAIVGNATAADAEHLQQFGINVGIAFQLQDDLLDIYGDPKRFGKQVGGDIIANKKTYLLLKAFELAEESDKKELKRWMYEEHDPSEKVKQITQLYDRLHVHEFTVKAMRSYTDTAFTALDRVKLSHPKKEPLRQLTESLLVRNS